MCSKTLSPTNFVKQILESIKPTCPINKLILYLDRKIYPNDFCVSVRPLKVIYSSKSNRTLCSANILNMKQLIDIFGYIPYISVKETQYRSVYRDPMIMTIDLTPKQFEQRTYYDYYIDKLCLRAELKKYISIEKKAHDVIHQYLNEHTATTTTSIDEYRTTDNDDDDKPF